MFIDDRVDSQINSIPTNSARIPAIISWRNVCAKFTTIHGPRHKFKMIQRTCMLIVAAILLSGCVSSMVNRQRSDWATQDLCKKDGGIKVFEKLQLAKGEFAGTSDISWSRKERVILGKYRIKQSEVWSNPYGYSIYKYTTWIERISDNARLSEMIKYQRPGDEILHGTVCPESISEQTLIDQTFIPQGISDPNNLPNCPSVMPPKILNLESTRTARPEPPRKVPSFAERVWKGNHNCEGLTEIGLYYENISRNEIRLTGTTLKFDSDSGYRCQVIAMASPNHILCSDKQIWLVGRKTISGKADFLIQKYARNGALISETTLQNSAVNLPGRIVGFYENTDAIGLQFVSNIEHQKEATCHQIVATKPGAENPVFIDGEQQKMSDEFAKWLPGCQRSTNIK